MNKGELKRVDKESMTKGAYGVPTMKQLKPYVILSMALKSQEKGYFPSMKLVAKEVNNLLGLKYDPWKETKRDVKFYNNVISAIKHSKGEPNGHAFVEYNYINGVTSLGQHFLDKVSRLPKPLRHSDIMDIMLDLETNGLR